MRERVHRGVLPPAATQDDGVALLEAAGLSGWVFPPASGWVAVVPDTPFRGSPSDEVTRSRGLIASFVHAEDHGWGLFVCLDGSPVWEYQCSWDPTIDIEEPYSVQDLGRVLERHGIVIDEAALDDALHPASVDDVITNQPARTAAKALQLPHHDWMQAGYLATDDGRAALARFVSA